MANFLVNSEYQIPPSRRLKSVDNNNYNNNNVDDDDNDGRRNMGIL